nr:hypothetical protein CFP56_21805 [Quercus suber]
MAPSSASSTPLSLFPSPASSFPPRSTSIKRVRAEVNHSPQAKLQGLAVQVSATQPGTSEIRLAREHLNHSLFCNPPIDETAQSVTDAHHLQSQHSSSRNVKTPAPNQTSPVSKDQVSSPARPVPTHTTPLKHGTSQRRVGPNRKKPKSPADHESLSSSSETAQWEVASDAPPRYPGTARSSGESSTIYNDTKSSPAPMRSIFPQYDHTKRLNQQDYFPSRVSRTATIPVEHVSKLGSPIEREALQAFDPDITLVEGYEHIPFAESSDVAAIWKASRGEHSSYRRKVRFGLLQPRETASIAIGRSQNELVYSMSTKSPSSPSYSHVENIGKQFTIQRHAVGTASAQVASLTLPTSNNSISTPKSQHTSLFPEQAAVHAIESAVQSPAAAEIAAFDPTGTSQAAARLAQDAVARARKRHDCNLIRSTRKRDSLDAVTARYNLEHPSLGAFPITISKSFGQSAAKGARAKICVHHPTATPAAITAETLVLAFLDFARDACVLDIPSLLSLENPYVIDLAVMAMLAVAAIENDALMSEQLTFPPPPKTPLKTTSRSPSKNARNSDKKDKAAARKQKKQESQSSKYMKKAKDELLGEQVELPLLAQGALSLVGLSLKVAIVVVEVGVKVTANAVVGAGRLATKL